MPEHGFGHGFHVVRRDEIPPRERGVGAAGEEQRLRGARTGANEDGVRLASRAHEVHDVGRQLVADGHTFERAAELGEVLGGNYGLDFAGGERLLGRVRTEHAVREFQLAGAVGRVHRDLEHEAVFLRLGQRIGALVLDRVLRREDGKVRRKRMRVAVDRHPPLLHGLEQRGLRFRGGAVDFIGEQKGGEDRPFDEDELVLLHVENARAGDVGGHEIGGELDAVELAPEHPRERAHEQRFGDTGHALDERVVAGEDGDERLIDHVLLADDDFAHFGAGTGEDVLDVGGVGGHGKI